MVTPLVTAVVGAVVLLSAAPSYADGEIGLSLDGQTWTAHLDRPLFPAAHRWVPGDRLTASLWVRNQTHHDAALTITLTTRGSGALFGAGETSLVATVRGRSVKVREDGRSRLVDLGRVAGGAPVRVDLAVAIAGTSTNLSQRRTTLLNLGAQLTQQKADAGGSTTGTPGNPGDSSPDDGDADARDAEDRDAGGGNSDSLPGTGAPAVRGLVLLGALSLGVGLALIARHRKGPHHD
ncbi:hypothetical protein [Nocardioides sp. LHG3406-4]|uniref:hypothetical protein n=1 Tax=Nocardioides sp. LHG3406-4 TaxID=2804575 RepID=UPI003CF8B8EB